MSYRDEREALKQRVNELEVELDGVQRRAEQAEGAQAQADRLAVELAGAQRNLERMQGELSKLQGPPRKPNVAAYVVVGVALVIFAFAATLVLFIGRAAAPSPASELTINTIEVVSPQLPPLPVPEIPPAAAAPPPVRVKMARWPGKVLASKGFSLSAGTPCSVEAILRAAQDSSIVVDSLVVQCGDKKLYRLSDSLEGMSFSSSKVLEEPGLEPGSYSYSIFFQDQGQRAGKRAEVSLESVWGKAVAWRNSEPVYRVSIQLDSMSESNKEPPLIQSHERAELDFRTRLELRATVTSVSGHSTVQNGQSCALKILPSWGGSGHNCRVSLRCGEQVLYGNGDSGYNRCEMKDGVLTSVRDEGASSQDGDPILLLDFAAPAASVRETGDDGFEIGLRLEKPKRVAQ